MGYIISHKDYGLFSSFLIEETRNNPIAIFTKDPILGRHAEVVLGFGQEDVANEVINVIHKVTGYKISDFKIISINNTMLPTDVGKKITYMELLNQGLNDELGYMIDTVPMISRAIH